MHWITYYTFFKILGLFFFFKYWIQSPFNQGVVRLSHSKKQVLLLSKQNSWNVRSMAFHDHSTIILETGNVFPNKKVRVLTGGNIRIHFPSNYDGQQVILEVLQLSRIHYVPSFTVYEVRFKIDVFETHVIQFNLILISVARPDQNCLVFIVEIYTNRRLVFK